MARAVEWQERAITATERAPVRDALAATQLEPTPRHVAALRAVLAGPRLEQELVPVKNMTMGFGMTADGSVKAMCSFGGQLQVWHGEQLVRSQVVQGDWASALVFAPTNRASR